MPARISAATRVPLFDRCTKPRQLTPPGPYPQREPSRSHFFTWLPSLVNIYVMTHDGRLPVMRGSSVDFPQGFRSDALIRTAIPPRNLRVIAMPPVSVFSAASPPLPLAQKRIVAYAREGVNTCRDWRSPCRPSHSVRMGFGPGRRNIDPSLDRGTEEAASVASRRSSNPRCRI